MGTLTGNTPSLPGDCPHKLATSCRLTATQLCCACQDKRPHIPYYSVYVDGVGFVARGTRWEKYCWFCKTFWTQRLADSSPHIRPHQSRIPEYPDQTEFLQKWSEYHQGFRLERHSDGSTQRIELQLARPWRDVPPGHLPNGADASRDRRLTGITPTPTRSSVLHSSHPDLSLDATLDDLLDQANAEEQSSRQHWSRAPATLSSRGLPSFDTPSELTNGGINAQLSNGDHPHQTQRAHGEDGVMMAERESPSSHMEVEVSTRPDTVTRSSQDVWNEHRRRVTEAQAMRDAHALRLENAELELQLARHELREAQRRTRAADNYARVFGTREEIQGAEYTSPVAGMFTRAWERYGIAEEVRSQERISIANSDRAARLVDLNHDLNVDPHAFYDSIFNPAHGVPSVGPGVPSSYAPQAPAALPSIQITPEAALHTPTPTAPTSDPAPAAAPVAAAAAAVAAAVAPASPTILTLDNPHDSRPPPKDDAELTKKLACKVCLSQLANVVLLPCGHVILCTWCADVQLPVRASDATRPRDARAAQCPLCRRRVKQRHRVFLAG